MKALRYILALFIAGVVTSCYEDEGNYVYNEDIHDISVKLKGSYGLRKTKSLIKHTVIPEIETVDGDKSYLEYLWIMRNNSTGVEDTVSLAEQAELEFDPNASDFSSTYDLTLYVTDTKTGGVTMAPTKIEFAMPYSYAWLLLHETDGHAELGTVEYIASDMVVVPDVYTAFLLKYGVISTFTSTGCAFSNNSKSKAIAIILTINLSYSCLFL